MKNGLCVLCCMIASGPMLQAQSKKGGGPPSESVRPAASRHIRTAVTGLLGWSVGVPSNAFGQITFTEAAVKTDALGLAFIEGTSSNLDPNLSLDAIAAIKSKLHALNLKMPVYRVASFPADENGRRKLFEFAKNLGVETIIAAPDPAALPALDKLATETGVNLAIDTRDSKSAMSMLARLGPHIGVSVEVPGDGLGLLKDRLMAVKVTSRANPAGLTQALVEIAKQEPPPEESPEKCSNCSRPYGGTRPLFIALDTNGIDAFEKAARPAMGYRVEQIARVLPITSPDRVPADERRKIEAALPRQALVKPKKARKLLVIDLCPAGGYYHTTIAHANLALELMAKNTGAYQPVFSNDLNNLKYPKIKEFDAVFLNSTVGEVFPDPDVLNGLMRFVREGGGLAGIHGASYASMDLPEFGEMIGAQDGPHRVETATLKIDDAHSPLTKAFGGKDFVREDEFYHFLPEGPYSREKLHVLISIDTEKSDMSQWHVWPDNDYGLSWIKSYGKGRVFNCAMGHTPTLFATPALAEHILAAIQFVLGDLDADTTPSAKIKR
jgi:type 1 glutamine amidotransferase